MGNKFRNFNSISITILQGPSVYGLKEEEKVYSINPTNVLIVLTDVYILKAGDPTYVFVFSNRTENSFRSNLSKIK